MTDQVMTHEHKAIIDTACMMMKVMKEGCGLHDRVTKPLEWAIGSNSDDQMLVEMQRSFLDIIIAKNNKGVDIKRDEACVFLRYKLHQITGSRDDTRCVYMEMTEAVLFAASKQQHVSH